MAELRVGLTVAVLVSTAAASTACVAKERDSDAATSGGAAGSSTTLTGGDGTRGTSSVTQQAHMTPIEAGSVTITSEVAVDTQGSGFAGGIWVNWDREGSAVFPVLMTDRTAEEVAEHKVCICGTAAQVEDGDYDKYWGAKVGWSVNQGLGDSLAAPADFSTTRGIRFTIHSETSAALRLNVEEWELDGAKRLYCASISPGRNTILWADLVTDCGAGGGTPFDPAVSTPSVVSWQVPGVSSGSTPFDFCIGGIETLPL